MGEENEQCLYRSERGERSSAWDYTHQECDQQHPDLGLCKGARGSGTVEVPKYLTEVPRYRPYSTAPVAGATHNNNISRKTLLKPAMPSGLLRLENSVLNNYVYRKERISH